MSHACLLFSFSWFQLIGGDQQRGCQLKCLLGVEPKALIGQTQILKLDSVVAPKGVLRLVVYVCGECPLSPVGVPAALSRYQSRFESNLFLSLLR
jgi:hypothetical protein